MCRSTYEEVSSKSIADEWRASPLSILFFSWLYPLLKVGASRPLQRSDLGETPRYDRVAQHAAAFETSWASTRQTFASLTTVFWSRMRKGVACKGLGDVCGYAQIFAVKAIVTYAEYRQSRETGGTKWSTTTVWGPARVADGVRRGMVRERVFLSRSRSRGTRRGMVRVVGGRSWTSRSWSCSSVRRCKACVTTGSTTTS